MPLSLHIQRKLDTQFSYHFKFNIKKVSDYKDFFTDFISNYNHGNIPFTFFDEEKQFYIYLNNRILEIYTNDENLELQFILSAPSGLSIIKK